MMSFATNGVCTPFYIVFYPQDCCWKTMKFECSPNTNIFVIIQSLGLALRLRASNLTHSVTALRSCVQAENFADIPRF
jgi:hypothetical protein